MFELILTLPITAIAVVVWLGISRAREAFKEDVPKHVRASPRVRATTTGVRATSGQRIDLYRLSEGLHEDGYMPAHLDFSGIDSRQVTDKMTVVSTPSRDIADTWDNLPRVHDCHSRNDHGNCNDHGSHYSHSFHDSGSSHSFHDSGSSHSFHDSGSSCSSHDSGSSCSSHDSGSSCSSSD
jgi:hypothetical protein